MFNFGDKLNLERVNNLNPVVLAFIGDAVYSLFVREKLVFSSDYKTGELNKLATLEVKATSQAELSEKLLPEFSEDELLVFKRARNAKKPTKSKSASVREYNMSTGFEAVLGYLYVLGKTDRINYLLNLGEKNEG